MPARSQGRCVRWQRPGTTWQWGNGLLQLPQGSPRREPKSAAGLDPRESTGQSAQPAYFAWRVWTAQQHHRFCRRTSLDRCRRHPQLRRAGAGTRTSLATTAWTRPRSHGACSKQRTAAPGPFLRPRTNFTTQKTSSHQDGFTPDQPSRTEIRFGPRQGLGAATESAPRSLEVTMVARRALRRRPVVTGGHSGAKQENAFSAEPVLGWGPFDWGVRLPASHENRTGRAGPEFRAPFIVRFD